MIVILHDHPPSYGEGRRRASPWTGTASNPSVWQTAPPHAAWPPSNPSLDGHAYLEKARRFAKNTDARSGSSRTGQVIKSRHCGFTRMSISVGLGDHRRLGGSRCTCRQGRRRRRYPSGCGVGVRQHGAYPRWRVRRRHTHNSRKGVTRNWRRRDVSRVDPDLSNAVADTIAQHCPNVALPTMSWDCRSQRQSRPRTEWRA